MNRRSFFRALPLAPAAALAGSPKPPANEVALSNYADLACAACGTSLRKRSLDPAAGFDSPLFVMCEFTRGCPLQGKAFLVPKLTFQAERADPVKVAAVISDEVAQSRARLLANEAEYAKFQKSLDYHT